MGETPGEAQQVRQGPLNCTLLKIIDLKQSTIAW